MRRCFGPGSCGRFLEARHIPRDGTRCRLLALRRCVPTGILRGPADKPLRGFCLSVRCFSRFIRYTVSPTGAIGLQGRGAPPAIRRVWATTFCPASMEAMPPGGCTASCESFRTGTRAALPSHASAFDKVSYTVGPTPRANPLTGRASSGNGRPAIPCYLPRRDNPASSHTRPQGPAPFSVSLPKNFRS